jgi:hypothetical protein
MKYTCTEYREEMLLLALRNRLNQENLSEAERRELLEQIKEIEKKMDME